MKKLAITIAGAVSLGAYEAGVAFEMLRAIAAHNEANANTPDNKIQIDVLTGASAGGMTATILAQKLLFEPSRLVDPANNDLFLPWVRDVDLSTLLALKSDEGSDLSALSSDLIETISKDYLTDPFSTGLNIQSEDPHPAAAPRIMLGLALSNLNGVDYGLQLASGGKPMPYTRFQDQLILEIDSAKDETNTADFWEPIRNAAVSCGAFPFAFRIKDLLRHASDYAEPQPLSPFQGTQHFAYTDGGVFQNEPIGLAKRLVDQIDGHPGTEQRFYLFIAPGMRESAANRNSAAPGSNFFNYLNTAKSLATAIFNQARYRDLENVEQINSQIDLFDKQAEGLRKLFFKGELNAGMTNPATKPLLEALFSRPIGETIDQARTRLRKQFAGEYLSLQKPGDDTSANAWVDAVLLLETVAALGPKDRMQVYAITDDSDQLAGSGFLAFAGFFDVNYRQHDYNQGRQSARKFIKWLNDEPTDKSSLGPINYDVPAQPPIVIDPAYTNLQLDKIPQSSRTQLRDRLHDRVHTLLEEAGMNWVTREAIDVAFLNSYFNKMFSL